MTENIQDFITAEHKRLLHFYGLRNSKELRHLIALKIIEEVGELAEELLSLDKIQRVEKLEHKKSRIDDEIADVLITVLLLAENLEIDLKDAISKGIQKRLARNY